MRRVEPRAPARKVDWQRVAVLISVVLSLGVLLYLVLPPRFKSTAAALSAAACLLLVRAALFGGQFIPIGRGMARGFRALTTFATGEEERARRPRRGKEE